MSAVVGCVTFVVISMARTFSTCPTWVITAQLDALSIGMRRPSLQTLPVLTPDDCVGCSNAYGYMFEAVCAAVVLNTNGSFELTTGVDPKTGLEVTVAMYPK